MSYLTLTDIINIGLELNAPISDGEILLDIIEDDKASETKQDMRDGENYFNLNNDILSVDFTEYIDDRGNKQYQANKANNRIAHGFFNRMILEKVSYLLKKPVTVSHANDPDQESEETGPTDIFYNIVGRGFDEKIMDWVEGASIKGMEWMHVYINEDKLNFIVMDAREIIPIYETSRQEKIISLIRYYEIMTNKGGQETTGLRVEWWHSDRVDIYEEENNKKLIFVESIGHFSEENTATNEKWGASWGVLPWICLKNNKRAKSDLRLVKDKIDAYDRSQSLLTNNLEDIQEVFLHVSGTADTPSEVREGLRNFKVAVSEDSSGSMTEHVIDIPIEARKFELQNLENHIYIDGMGTNPLDAQLGNDPSGVAMRWKYAQLDLKVGLLETRLIGALHELAWFVCEYVKKAQPSNLIDPDGFEFVFTKSLISNISETVNIISKSEGILSRKTLVERHPFVQDVSEEMARIEKESSGLTIPFEENITDDTGPGE